MVGDGQEMVKKMSNATGHLLSDRFLFYIFAVCLRFVYQVLNLTTKALNFNAFYQGPFSAPAYSHMSFPDTRTQED